MRLPKPVQVLIGGNLANYHRLAALALEAHTIR